MRVTFLNYDNDPGTANAGDLTIRVNGHLLLKGDPQEPDEAATKRYVDQKFNLLSCTSLKTGLLSDATLPGFVGDATALPGGNHFSLNASGVVADVYCKVQLDSKGRVINGFPLSVSDIPPLSWSNVGAGKPTTLAGYGITDAIDSTGDTLGMSVTLTAAPSQPLHLVNRSYLDAKVAAVGSSAPVGTVKGFPSKVTPVGYLRANNGAVSKTVYSELYALIGDRYSAGNSYPGAGKPWQLQYGINNGFDGVIDNWIVDTALPAALDGRVLVTRYYAYLIGVRNSGITPTVNVYRAPINPDGTLGTWAVSPHPLPAAVTAPGVVATRDRVYVVGGYTGTDTPSAVVYSAAIEFDGTLGSWRTELPLPAAAAWPSVVVINHKLYAIGGWLSNTTSASAVYVANVNADGTLSAWAAAAALPTPRGVCNTFTTRSRLYVLGGMQNYTNFTDGYTATINADGTLGSWTSAPALPIAAREIGVYVTSKRVHLIGGKKSGSGAYSATYSAAINPDGTLGSWTQGPNLPAAISYGGLFATSSRIYQCGGLGDGGVTADVYSAALPGGLNSYADYYGVNMAALPSDYFLLPDYSQEETPESYFYIKY